MVANFPEVMRDGFEPCRTISNMEIVVNDTIARIYTGLPGPFFNAVHHARFKPQEVESQVDAVIEYFKQRKIPFSWWIDPTSRPDTLEDVLLSRGFAKDEWAMPAMAIDLRTLDEQLLEKATHRSTATIQPVQTETELKDWLDIVAKAFEFHPQTVEAFHELHSFHLHRGTASNIINFIASIDGTPAGASSIIFSTGLAGLYNVATLNEYRGKGIGTAVSIAPLLVAKDQGYEIGNLQSSQMGFHLYQRIGFKTYFEYKIYLSPTEK